MSQMDFMYLNEIIVDNFAGGGGASTGIEWAFGRSPDVAVNHDPEAVAMHAANHPNTRHYCEDVWHVDPREACGGRPVGFAWFSPDCKHHSKAKGGKPVDKAIRGLAWVVLKWAYLVRPRVMALENVEEFGAWGPLTDDNRPCPIHRGRTFTAFVKALSTGIPADHPDMPEIMGVIGEWVPMEALVRGLGYAVDWRELRACDYGAPTIRKRLFLVGRCDGRAIAWPRPTHGDPSSQAVKKGQLQPWRTAAECIDWSIPTRSIFGRARPLADATLRRIARGMKRYVIDATEPFIVTCNHAGDHFRGQGLREPFKTITSARDAHGLVMPFVSTYYGQKSTNEVRGSSVSEPLRTQTTENRHAFVTAFLVKHYGGNYKGHGVSLSDPVSTVTTVDHHAMVASYLVKLRGTCKDGQPNTAPIPTVTAGGLHIGEVRAFLIKYYSAGGQDQSVRDPLHTIPTTDRFGLVTVRGEQYQIADIGMRMLEPRELYRAQGFPEGYIIDPDANGKRLSKAAQVRMCGNSVVPHLACALVQANVGVERRKMAA